MRNWFICWISPSPLLCLFGSMEWIRSVGYLHGFIFQSQSVPKKQRWWGGRTSSLGIENNPVCGKNRRSSALSCSWMAGGLARMRSESGRLRQTENAAEGARTRLFHAAQTFTERSGLDRAQTEVRTVWESSLFTVTRPTSCQTVCRTSV